MLALSIYVPQPVIFKSSGSDALLSLLPEPDDVVQAGEVRREIHHCYAS